MDFLFEAPEITLETLEPVVQAYRDAGMRATILLGVTDKTFADSLPLTDAERAQWSRGGPPSLERIKPLATEAVDRWHEPDGLIRIGMGPSAPQRCSDELMAWSLELVPAPRARVADPRAGDEDAGDDRPRWHTAHRSSSCSPSGASSDRDPPSSTPSGSATATSS